MNKIKNIIITAIMILIVSFFTFVSIIIMNENYDESSRICNNYKETGKYLVPVSKYLENDLKFPYWVENPPYMKACIYYENLDKNSENELRNKINNKLDVYNSYFYNVSFNNFVSGNNLELNKGFYSIGFKTLMVSNFNNFYQPLKYGRFPKNKNEVLIYDYMEESLLYQNVINEPILGKELYDNVNDNRFVVCGVLKSFYKDFYEMNFDTNKYSKNDILSYLNELETIICFKELFDEIKISSNYCFNSVYLFSNSASIKLSNIINCDKNNKLDDFEYEFTNTSAGNNTIGYVMTKKSAMKALEITDVNEFDNSSFGTEFKGSQAFLNTFEIKTSYDNYSSDISHSYLCNSAIRDIVGIIDDLENEGIYFLRPHIFANDNLTIRSLIIALKSDWNYNINIIGDLFWPKDKEDSYYEKLTKGNEIVDYCIYDSFEGHIVRNRRNITTLTKVCNVLLLDFSMISLSLIAFIIYYSIFDRKYYYFY